MTREWHVEVDAEGDGEVVREEKGATRRILLGLHNPTQTLVEAEIIANALNKSDRIIYKVREGLERRGQ